MNPRLLKNSAVFCALVFLASCSTSRVVKEPGQNDAIGQLLESEVKETVVEKIPEENRTASDIENLTIGEVIRIEEPNTANLYDNSRYDFPITMNSKVEGWMDYFTGRGRGHMERYLSRSSRYMPVMKAILKKAGVPEDLIYLALIESGFNLRAKSRAKAVGPWQFMKATGKRYGLRVDAWVDERRDPIRSTEAAANYLKDLYLMFESWYLAASAYNAGEYKVLKAIDELKTNNFWRISETKMLRRETKDYVPKLIAAAIIAKNAKKYGFHDLDYQDPLAFETVSIDKPLRLKEVARIIEVEEDDILDLNPSFTRGTTPPSGGSYELRVPIGKRGIAQRTVASGNAKLEASDIPVQYKVLRGDTLAGVARRYRIKPKDLANTNNLSTKEALVPGIMLIIPHTKGPEFVAAHPVPTGKRTLSTAAPIPVSTDSRFLIHVVKSGESLWSISEQYDVTVQSIFKWNNLKRSSIHPGKHLKIKSQKNS